MIDDYNVIGRSLFKKETNIQIFVGLRVRLSSGELGTIDSAFGQSGKFKIHIPGEWAPWCLPWDTEGWGCRCSVLYKIVWASSCPLGVLAEPRVGSGSEPGLSS